MFGVPKLYLMGGVALIAALGVGVVYYQGYKSGGNDQKVERLEDEKEVRIYNDKILEDARRAGRDAAIDNRNGGELRDDKYRRD